MLLACGTLVGVDLVSVPQMMIARPLVAGTIAGALLGDVETGLRVGVGVRAVRSSTSCPSARSGTPSTVRATVAAVAAAHWSGGPLALGIGAGVGLLAGLLGGVSMHWLRTANARAVRAVSAALESGDVRALRRVHWGGLLRDAGRACTVTAAGLAAARLLSNLRRPALPPVTLVFAAAAAAGAAVASVGRGCRVSWGAVPALKWLVAGLAGGVVVAWVR